MSVIFIFFSLLQTIDDLEIKCDYKIGTFLDKNKNYEIRIFYKIPRNRITYIKLHPSGTAGDKFIAKLEILCKLTQKHKEFGNIEYIVDTVENYDQTLSKTYIDGNIKVKTEPGNYNLELQIKDLNSQRLGKIKTNIVAKNLTKMPFSDVILINDTTIYVEVYNELQKPLLLTYKIEGKTMQTGKIEIGEKFINPINIYLQKDSISYGKCLIKLAIENFSPISTQIVSEIEDTLYIEEPFFLKNYEKRVKQLYCIAKKEEIDSLLNIPKEKREFYWKNFWARKDSLFGKHNIEEEYFKRVDYANEKFSCGIEGWKTDRGRIYIKLGPPDEIDSHPFEINQKPYEIWYYYAKGLKFIFVDKHGFGEYILTYPHYWDEEIQIE